MTRYSRDIVHGVYADELVFIPTERARHLASTWKAMLKSKTWGELKKLAPLKAYREILQFQESPRSIRSGHVFDYYTMTPVPEGDYPGFPQQEVMEWMPKDILREYGRMMQTSLNGDYPAFDPQVCQTIVERLKQHGFRCRRNQRLINAALSE